MVSEMMAYRVQQRDHQSTSSYAALHEINPSYLQNPKGMKDSMDVWIGRGSFGVVKLQIYRGVEVAVKELLPKTLLADLQHEAKIIMNLCHPNLPFLFGICTKSPSYKLVFQFHGLNSLGPKLFYYVAYAHCAIARN